MDNTKIDWADMSWNPVTGCRHDCEYCYARGIATRFAGFEPRCGGEDVPDSSKKHGENSIWNTTHGEVLHVFSEQPMKRAKAGNFIKAPYPYNFEPTLHRYRLDEPARKKRPRNIFVGSMADIFGDWVPAVWIRDVLDACAAAPQHNYLFLTKNPGRYIELDRMALLSRDSNFWYGTTVTTPEQDYFYSTHHKTFLSIEPLMRPMGENATAFKGMDWVIVGAMTGPGSEKRQPERAWVEDIVKQCRERNIPVFMKGSLAELWGEPLIQEVPPELKREAQNE